AAASSTSVGRQALAPPPEVPDCIRRARNRSSRRLCDGNDQRRLIKGAIKKAGRAFGRSQRPAKTLAEKTSSCVSAGGPCGQLSHALRDVPQTASCRPYSTD